MTASSRRPSSRISLTCCATHVASGPLKVPAGKGLTAHHYRVWSPWPNREPAMKAGPSADNRGERTQAIENRQRLSVRFRTDIEVTPSSWQLRRCPNQNPGLCCSPSIHYLIRHAGKVRWSGSDQRVKARCGTAGAYEAYRLPGLFCLVIGTAGFPHVL